MPENVGGATLSQTATGGGLPQGQNPTPTMDIGGSGAGGPTLATYYTDPATSMQAQYDASGRGMFNGQDLAGSAAAVKAGLVGSGAEVGGAVPGGATVPGQSPPASGLAPSGALAPGPGQEGAAAGAQSLAQGTGQTGASAPPEAPLPAASAPTSVAGAAPDLGYSPAPNTTPTGAGGAFQPPSGWTTGPQPDAMGNVVVTSPDGTQQFTMDPRTGSLVPYAPPPVPQVTAPNTAQAPPPPVGSTTAPPAPAQAGSTPIPPVAAPPAAPAAPPAPVGAAPIAPVAGPDYGLYIPVIYGVNNNYSAGGDGGGGGGGDGGGGGGDGGGGGGGGAGPSLVTRAAMAMGYQPKSLLRMHLDEMYQGYLRMNPKMGQNWVKEYQASAQKIMNRMSREPQGVQDLMHNHILEQTIGPNQKNLHVVNEATVNKFWNNVWKVHNRLADHYGLPTKLSKPLNDMKPPQMPNPQRTQMPTQQQQPMPPRPQAPAPMPSLGGGAPNGT